VEDPLWGTTWKIAAGALLLSLIAAIIFVLLGQTLNGVGLFCGAFLSAANFAATSRFVDLARRTAAAGEGNIAAGGRAAAGFVMRYLFLALILVLLIIGFRLPAATTVLGVAAVPLTIYLWQMTLLVTGRWRRQF
jgi:hypothetical protein